MFGPRRVRRDKRQVHVRLHRGRQLHLRLLGRFLEPLQRHLVPAQIDPLVLLELVGQVIHHPQIKVLAAQMRVPVGRLDLKNPLANLQYRNVERPAAQVEHRYLLLLALVQPVGQRRRRRLVDDPQHVQPRDLARILGRLALTVVKIRRHRDHRVIDRLA